MGFLDAVKGQFLDVIEYEDISNKILVYKFRRSSGNNELKQGSQVIVRPGQCAVFVKQGTIADILGPGKYSLNTENFPVLSSLKAFPFLFSSPVISDVYFVSTRQLIDNKWATKTPVMKRDSEFGLIRIRSFGKYSFRIVNVEQFMNEIFGAKGLVTTFDVVNYLSSLVTESFASMIGATDIPAIDLSAQYHVLSSELLKQVNINSQNLGLEFSNMIIESLSLPEEVEKYIDEQSGINMAKKDMDAYMQFNTVRAMRDASKQKNGLAGLGAGFAVSNKMVNALSSGTSQSGKSKAEQLRELKCLLDDGILTNEEFEAEKTKILNR